MSVASMRAIIENAKPFVLPQEVMRRDEKAPLPTKIAPPAEVKTPIFHPVKADTLLSDEAEVDIKWVWSRMIPTGILFLLAGYMKAGKTELIYRLAVAIAQGRAFLGFATARSAVLILAVEEHPRDVKRRLVRLGLQPGDAVYVHAGPLPNDDATLAAVSAFVMAKGIALVLMDTWGMFGGLVDENSNAETIIKAAPLLALARTTDAAVGLIHHEKKAGGDGGRGIRGASSLFGLVDQAFLLERRQGGADTQRVLKTLGRYEESPKELVIDLQADGYEVVGTPEEASLMAATEKIKEAVGEAPQTTRELAEGAEVSAKIADKVLRQLSGAGEIVREGGGRRGDPFTYRTSNSILHQELPPKLGGETEKGGYSPPGIRFSPLRGGLGENRNAPPGKTGPPHGHGPENSILHQATPIGGETNRAGGAPEAAPELDLDAPIPTGGMPQ